MAVLALEIEASCRHMTVERYVRGISVGQRDVSTFIGISAASPGVTLQAVLPKGLVDCLDCLIHGYDHVCCIRNKYTARFDPFILYLVTYEAIYIFELGL